MFKRISDGMTMIVTFNFITMLGSLIATISVLLMVVLYILESIAILHAPYIGLITFMLLPGGFVSGLLLIPVGWLWERKRKHSRDREKGVFYPIIDFNHPHVRSITAAVTVFTMLNVIIISIVTYKGVVYTESVEFCGQVCHTVMEPEFAAYQDSPHSRVECVKCHIGPGADWFARSKVSGVRQVLAVLRNSYSRPVESPVYALRPSKDTCEQCHWPDRFAGDKIRIIERYQADEENTKTYSILSMHIGGGAHGGNGIHNWHIDENKTTSYFHTDDKRQDIPLVRVTKADGTVTEYKTADFDESQLAEGQWRTMDCIDCHNRPTHNFDLPTPAVDEKMATGEIDVSLPYIKKIAVEALTGVENNENDLTLIASTINNFYQENYPERATESKESIDQAIQAVQAIYSRNVFPKMGMEWGEHVNNLGHEFYEGCFRCHDEEHEAENGEVISQDCMLCHGLLAWDEEAPEILELLEMQ